jgi:hypothetical protein
MTSMKHGRLDSFSAVMTGRKSHPAGGSSVVNFSVILAPPLVLNADGGATALKSS